MKLYELTGQFRVLESFEIESTEDGDAMAALWSEISDQFDQKVENAAKLIQNLKADIEAIENESSRLAKRKASIAHKIESIKNYLQYEMESNGFDKIKGQVLTVSIQNNPQSVEIDESVLPDEYWKIKREPSKTLAKDALLEGKEVPGAKLIQTRSLRIR